MSKILCNISLTLILAKCLKASAAKKALHDAETNKLKIKGKSIAVKKARALVISRLNAAYLAISITSCILIYLYQWLSNDSSRINVGLFTVVLWSVFLFSRSHEISCAFLHDAFDSLNKKRKSSLLNNSKRLALSLRSYIELVLNFAIFYYIVPVEAWKESKAMGNIIESIYFSGVTITTLGYGDYTPVNHFVQLATVYEVFCGFILLIIAFAMYTNKEPNNAN